MKHLKRLVCLMMTAAILTSSEGIASASGLQPRDGSPNVSEEASEDIGIENTENLTTESTEAVSSETEGTETEPIASESTETTGGETEKIDSTESNEIAGEEIIPEETETELSDTELSEEDWLLYLEQAWIVSGIELDTETDYAELSIGESMNLPAYKLNYTENTAQMGSKDIETADSQQAGESEETDKISEFSETVPEEKTLEQKQLEPEQQKIDLEKMSTLFQGMDAEVTEKLLREAEIRIAEQTEVIYASDSAHIVIDTVNHTIQAVSAGTAVIRISVAGNEEIYTEFKVLVKPDAPKTVRLNKASPSNYNTIMIGWNAAEGAAGYEIYRKAAGEADYTRIADTENEDTSAYTDTGIKTGISYSYMVRAYVSYIDGSGEEKRIYASDSNVLSAKTKLEKVKIENITAKSHNSIILKWDKVNGADFYEIYRSAGTSKSFKKIETVKGNVLSYTDKNLSTGTKYNYKIRAYRSQDGGKVYGDYSSITSANAAPPAPVITIKKNSYNSLELSFEKVSGASGYELYRKTGNGSYKKIDTYKSNAKLSYKDGDVKTGTKYYYRVRAYRAVDGKKIYGSYSKVVDAVPSLAKPKLSLKNGTYNSVKLEWKKVSGASGYEIFQMKGKSSYSRIKTITNSGTISYTKNKLTSGVVYSYKIRAYRTVNGKKIYSGYSSVAERKMVPSAVEVSTAEAGSNAVRLNWKSVNLPSKNSGYYVYQVTSEGDKLLTTKSNSSRSHTITGLKMGKKYTFKVVAYMKDSKGNVIEGETSGSVTASPKLLKPVISSIKSNGYDSIKVSWNSTSKQGEDTYIVYRAASKSGKYKEVGRVSRKTGKTAYSFTDKKLGIGKTYYYKVRCLENVAGYGKAYSSYSPVKSGKPMPAAPEVTVTSKSYNSMKIAWKKVKGSSKNGYADGYEIYRSTSKNGSYKKIKTITNWKTSSITDSKLSTGKTYYYKIRAYCNVKGKKLYGAYSSIKAAKVEPAKVNLKKVSSAGYNSVKLTWDKVSGTSGYQIYRASSSNGTYKSVKTIKSGSTVTFTDKGLSTGKKYYYKVRAYRSLSGKNIYSKFSDVKSVKPELSVPKNLKAVPENINQIKLTWDKVSGAEYYTVLRSTSQNGTYSVLKEKCTKNTYTNTRLDNGKKYYYKVFAVRKSYVSKHSGVISGKAGVFIITNREISIQVGESVKADVIVSPSATIKWSSKNNNIATVSSGGEIRGISEGTTKIVGKANGITSEINLTVKRTLNGIDVSKWQGNINFGAVRASGVDFVMIRIFNGYVQDPYFEQNYANARAAGLKVGVYAYSVANSSAQAQQEARTVLSILNGRHLDFPISMDVEDNAMLSGGLSNADRTNMIFDFRNVVVTGGYRFILYANTYWLNNYIENTRLNGIDIWVARYRDLGMGHGYAGGGNVTMWQYSSKGSVNGINGNVDMNICYSSY